MVGVFNTIDHETEVLSKKTSGNLMVALSRIYLMLEAVEKGDIVQANKRQQNALKLLNKSANGLNDLADQAGDYLLSPNSLVDITIEDKSEIKELFSELKQFGFSLPLRNSDLPRIGAWETQSLAERVRTAKFNGSLDDWFPIRDIIKSAERLMIIGLIAARLSTFFHH